MVLAFPIYADPQTALERMVKSNPTVKKLPLTFVTDDTGMFKWIREMIKASTKLKDKVDFVHNPMPVPIKPHQRNEDFYERVENYSSKVFFHFKN